jgi:hypothetical protein
MKVILHPTIRQLSGKMGDVTFRVMYGKQTVMKTPDLFNVKWSKAQKAERSRFAKAIRYAKQAMAGPKIRAHYEKVGKQAGRQPFLVAVSDFMAGKNLLESK